MIFSSYCERKCRYQKSIEFIGKTQFSPPALENPTINESENQKKHEWRQISKNKNGTTLKERHLSKPKKKINGRRTEKTDKKFRSNLYLALGNEGKRIFGQKFTKVKILQISFEEFWENFSAAFARKTNFTFERHKVLNRKPRDRESLEQF